MGKLVLTHSRGGMCGNLVIETSDNGVVFSENVPGMGALLAGMTMSPEEANDGEPSATMPPSCIAELGDFCTRTTTGDAKLVLENARGEQVTFEKNTKTFLPNMITVLISCLHSAGLRDHGIMFDSSLLGKLGQFCAEGGSSIDPEATASEQMEASLGAMFGGLFSGMGR